MSSTLTIHPPRLEQTTAGNRVSAKLQAPGFSQELWYEVSGSPLTTDATPFAIAALPIAMARGWNVQSEGPVSALLTRSVPKIQDMLCLWIRQAQRIEWKAPVQASQPRLAPSGTFFSGGVDSYYTFLKHQEAISSLIFVTGFDVPLHKIALAERVGNHIRSCAKAFQKNLIEVKTNLREFCDQFVSWRYYHGAALGSVANLLSAQVGTVYLAATHTYANLIPCGSHPMLDPLWSSEAVKIVHDGCEATRFQKVERMAQNPIALGTVRVCYHNKASELNCGRCEKCLRTMTSLYALNALDQCKTFDAPFNLQRIAGQRLGDNPRILVYVEQNMAALKERMDNPHEVVSALKLSMRKSGLLRGSTNRLSPCSVAQPT
ncbi:MAG: hypothetical protein QM703_04760 [Gemmatales bacterium]